MGALGLDFMYPKKKNQFLGGGGTKFALSFRFPCLSQKKLMGGKKVFEKYRPGGGKNKKEGGGAPKKKKLGHIIGGKKKIGKKKTKKWLKKKGGFIFSIKKGREGTSQ